VVRSADVTRKHRTQALTALTALGLLAAACGGTDESAPAASATGESIAPASPAPAATSTPAATAEATEPPTTTSSTATSSSAGAIGDPVPAPALADLVLPDHSTFELSSLEGEPVLVYFGYTHCPDVCPATIGELFGVFEAEPETQALFVSVDPERDTPEFLEEWTKYLPDNLYAVTGSPGAIRRAADNYGVKYARVETTSTAGYTMSHTAALYLIDADGQLLLDYPFGTPAAEIVEDLRALDAS